ncbi:uncharacterized protein LOC100574312 [Acyrthosiphon pisum]|uniref:Uncharacterized protein n=1 Tax=Acyrthosiphon pisum TaxID=7029 RepID=A0A8R1WAD1_ACYPI|nr:uncharacterized protein LOC100574312 [Acyrthosiphon pisum]|eukprot:XP_003243117.1 PREDICTED: uncharacterized protein LOC100574312 [Acyrthosiphon pisum]
MTIYIDEGLLKITQKMCLIALTIYAYIQISSEIRTCSQNKIGSKIYPFDSQFFESSVLFLTAAAICIVECDIWPNNTKPRNRMIRFLAELYIMTMAIILVYVLFWHPIVITTSIFTDKLSILTLKWLGSANIHKKNISICMGNIRSTKLHCNIFSSLILYHVLEKFGKKDLRRIKCLF